MHHLIAPALLLASVTTPGRADSDDIDISAYPELARDVLLPPIIAALKGSLADPYSIRDMVVCPATKVKLRDGKPVRWAVLFSLNAKNSFGGYTGVQTYSAIFRDGTLSGGINSTAMPGNDGFAGLINSAIRRKMALCPTVSDTTVQQLLSPGASVFTQP